MEDENNLSQKFKTLTCIKKPGSLQYLTDDIIVVRHRGVPHQCSLVDVKKDKIIMDFPYSHFAVHSTNKKIAFSYKNYVTIYNFQTNQYEWSREEEYDVDHIHFSSQDSIVVALYNSYFRCDLIVQHNYRNSSVMKLDISMDRSASIALNLQKQTMCITNNYVTILYNLANVKLKRRQKIFPEYVYGCKISCDNLIAVKTGLGNKIFIIDLQSDNRSFPFIESDLKELFVYMLFYHGGSVLVTRSRNSYKNMNIIRYWDILTKQVIYTTSFESSASIIQEFAFSPNGEEIAIACDDEVFIDRVPFEVILGLIYKIGTRKKSIYFLWILRKYAIQQQQHQNIPEEIIKLLLNNYLELSRR